MYTIRNKLDNSLAWSNKYGWIDDEEYDLFTNDEKKELNLPTEGRWVYIGEEYQSN